MIDTVVVDLPPTITDGSPDHHTISFRAAYCDYSGDLSEDERPEIVGTSSCTIPKVKDLVDIEMEGPWQAAPVSTP